NEIASKLTRNCITGDSIAPALKLLFEEAGLDPKSEEAQKLFSKVNENLPRNVTGNNVSGQSPSHLDLIKQGVPLKKVDRTQPLPPRPAPKVDPSALTVLEIIQNGLNESNSEKPEAVFNAHTNSNESSSEKPEVVFNAHTNSNESSSEKSEW
ncbi:MAG: hypothetical protein LBH08_01675, partial [Puniceicoccales bacterium]|nr:hypothetical protein [Puniceicoccales bacterium]